MPCLDCGRPGSALCQGCRRKRGTTTERGYGSRHQLARQQALATYDPDELCWRCGQTLGDDPSALALDHDETRSEYAGLVHLNPCNSGKRMPPGGWGESSERVGTPDPR